MKKWTTEGHLSELALETWAAGEAEAHETGAIQSHLETCEACRAREAEWQGMFHALASLAEREPSRSLDEAVMARLRLPAEEEVAAAAYLPKLVRRLRPVAVGVVAAWAVALLFGTAWMETRLDVSVGTLLTGFLAFVRQQVLEAVIRLGAYLELSGLAELLGRVGQLPGLGIVAGLAVMTTLSMLAIWMLYRVTGYQPSRDRVNV